MAIGGEPDQAGSSPGLMSVFGWKTEDEARKNVKVYQDYDGVAAESGHRGRDDCLATPPACPVAIEAMKAGKHVLTEKLMAHDIAACKNMGRVARSRRICYLATGHQRHYSVLYDNAVHLAQAGTCWGNCTTFAPNGIAVICPGKDSWKQALPGGEIDRRRQEEGSHPDRPQEVHLRIKRSAEPRAEDVDRPEKQVAQWTAWNADRRYERRRLRL